MGSFKLLLLFVTVLACGCSAKDSNEKTCSKRTENIYTKASTEVKEFDIINGLTNIYTITSKLVYSIFETFVKYFTKLVHEIERTIVGIAKAIKIEVRN